VGGQKITAIPDYHAIAHRRSIHISHRPEDENPPWVVRNQRHRRTFELLDNVSNLSQISRVSSDMNENEIEKHLDIFGSFPPFSGYVLVDFLGCLIDANFCTMWGVEPRQQGGRVVATI
jgi:hypothetical protein